LRRENGITWDDLDANELRQVEPNLSRDYVKGVVIRENGHTTNPHRLVNTLLETFLRNGGRIERTRAVGFDLDGSRLKAIRTADGVRSADAAVVAAGIWSRPLARELGDKLPLETERGYHLMIRDPEVIPRMPITDAQGKFVVTPMELGLRAAGTVELAGLRAPPNWERARVLLRHLRQLFPALRENYSDERLSKWMGHRPSLPDSLPVIGRSRRSPDVIYAFGHGHIGMASAPMTGKLVADLVAGQSTSINIAPFAPGRFG
jgi:D-amino-acid dehydrogenase